MPCLVVSPFSRGGYLCSQTFDHTSTLRFLETLFGVPVPNLSTWRRSVTGDMTRTLALKLPPDTSVPTLPTTSLGDTTVAEQAVINALAGTEDVGRGLSDSRRERDAEADEDPEAPARTDLTRLRRSAAF